MPAPHHSDFYRPDALPAAQPNSVKALKAAYLHNHNHYTGQPVSQLEDCWRIVLLPGYLMMATSAFAIREKMIMFASIMLLIPTVQQSVIHKLQYFKNVVQKGKLSCLFHQQKVLHIKQ